MIDKTRDIDTKGAFRAKKVISGSSAFSKTMAQYYNQILTRYNLLILFRFFQFYL